MINGGSKSDCDISFMAIYGPNANRKISIRIWKIVLFSLPFLPIVTFQSAAEETSDMRIYGRCVVTTEVDEITDRQAHMVGCVGNNGEMLSIMCTEFKNVISLKPAEFLFHYEDMVHVQYRFDKLDHVQEDWFWNSRTGFANNDIADMPRDRFLHKMASAKRIVFRVEYERGAINFEDETSNSVNDFKSRCSLSFP